MSELSLGVKSLSPRRFASALTRRAHYAIAATAFISIYALRVPFPLIVLAAALVGLELAETTPGPLIMVLQFIGFMAAWNHPQGMTPALSGVIGALVATWTTFLPSFIFIFLGAPYIESLRGNRRLQGALSGVTAAIVGVILNLALVFGSAVIWPRGLAGGTKRRENACFHRISFEVIQYMTTPSIPNAPAT